MKWWSDNRETEWWNDKGESGTSSVSTPRPETVPQAVRTAMNDHPRDKLRELVARYGRGLADDPRQCQALLHDVSTAYRREVSVLVAAAESGVGSELLRLSGGTPLDTVVPRLALRLENETGLTPEAARWAVDSWAMALGMAGPEMSGAPPSPRAQLSPIVRFAISVTVVLAAALITDRLLQALGSAELLSKLGFSWLAAVTKVDDYLETRRLSLSILGRRADAPPTGRRNRALVVAYGAVVIAGVVELISVLFGVVLGITLDDVSADALRAPLAIFGLLTTPVIVYLVGRWLGTHHCKSAVPNLFAMVVTGLVIVRTTDLLLLGPAEYEQLYLAGYLTTVLVSIIWVSFLSATVGLLGVRSGRRRLNRVQSSGR